MLTCLSHSPEETTAFAFSLAGTLTAGTVLAFTGDLGMGKTTFVKGLADGLGYTGCVTSPTFAYMNEYSGGRLPVYHYDMYRLSSWDDLEAIGFFDYLNAGGIVAVEWSERITAALPEDTLFVRLTRIDDTTRLIQVGKEGELGETVSP